MRLRPLLRKMGTVTTLAATMSSGAPQVTSRDERILRVRAATFPRRFSAAIVDLVIVAGLATGVTIVAALILGVKLPTPRELGPDLVLAGLLERHPMALGGIGLFFGIGALYQIYLGGVTGQTIGKWLFGLRVISIRGTTPGPIRGILRLLALFLSFAPLGLGWLWCLFDRERRSVHDHLVGTYVIMDT